MESLVQMKRKIKGRGKGNNLPTGFLLILKSPASAAARRPMQRGTLSTQLGRSAEVSVLCNQPGANRKFPIPQKQQEHTAIPPDSEENSEGTLGYRKHTPGFR